MGVALDRAVTDSFEPSPDSDQASGAETLETMEGAARYNRWVFDRVRQGLGRRVLEIGCGVGTITAFLLDRDLVVGVDVREDYVRAATARYRGHANVVVRLQDLTKSTEGLSEFAFDSAISVNVFEHIPDDVGAMRAIWELLVPGGTLNVLVPCHPRLLGTLDRDIGHVRRYRKEELRSKLEQSGFLVERMRYSNPVGAIGWLLNVRLLGSRRLHGLALYERLVPILSALDRFELPIGLSLIATARKPMASTSRRPTEQSLAA